MTPDQYCQEKAAQSGSSFYYSFLFLAPQRRRAITALYAYCREVDDVVDECEDQQIAATKLAWWRSEVQRIYANTPHHPVANALVPIVRDFGIAQDQLLEILDGMAMDLTTNRYPIFADLRVYCHRVAGVVGLLAARIFGYTEDATLDYAHELGIAFQLTNIIRDVGEDARKNRVYVPLEDLDRFRVPLSDILNARHSEGFKQLIEFQIDRAQGYYQRAFAALPAIDRKSQRAGLIMAAIYRTLLDEIARDGSHVLNHRIALTPIRKLWLAAKTWAVN